MTETKRPPLSPLTVAALLLGLAAVVCAGALVAGWWFGPRLLPSPRYELWCDAWAGAWGWPAWIATMGGLLVGWVAVQMAAHGDGVRARDLRLARCGVALSMVSVVALVCTLVTPVSRRTSWSKHKSQCMANVRNVAMALQIYLEDYDRYPPAEAWSDVLYGYVKGPEVYRCPEAAGRCGYAYNAVFSRQPVSAVSTPNDVIGFFESDAGWNAHGGEELMASFPRHFGGDILGFPDGHARWWAREKPAAPVAYDTRWPHAFASPEAPRWQTK
jgi:hypothetical protein